MAKKDILTLVKDTVVVVVVVSVDVVLILVVAEHIIFSCGQ